MKRDYEEVLSYYKEKLKGQTIEEIEAIAKSAYKNVIIDKVNRELGLIQEEMASRGLKHFTFKWIYETDKALIKLNKKYKLTVKTKPLKYLIGNEKPKIILYVIISKILNRIVALHNCMNEAMCKDNINLKGQDYQNHRFF